MIMTCRYAATVLKRLSKRVLVQHRDLIAAEGEGEGRPGDQIRM